MDLLVIAGFLGSGKTSTLIEVAKRLREEGVGKIAIIENEIGRDGVDGERLRDAGLSVEEIYAGCICCQLAGDLLTTATRLHEEYAPDLLIVEPTGVAGPGQVLHAFQGFEAGLGAEVVMVLLDASRFEKIRKAAMPYIEGCMRDADLAVLNKVDLLEAGPRVRVARMLQAVREDLTVVPASMKTGENVDLVATLISDTLAAHRQRTGLRDAPAEKFPFRAAVVQRVLELDAGEVRPAEVWRAQAERFLSEAGRIADELSSGLGHIKMNLKTDAQEHLFLSLTSFGEVPDCWGDLTRPAQRATATLNAIVCDVKASAFDDLSWPQDVQ